MVSSGQKTPLSMIEGISRKSTNCIACASFFARRQLIIHGLLHTFMLQGNGAPVFAHTKSV